MKELEKLISNSFLKELIDNGDITDISFNGSELFYVDNLKGRKKADIVVSHKEVLDFLRQISNLTNIPFSIKDPILDVSFANYRLNASFYTLTHKDKEEVVSFALRIFPKTLKISRNSGFFPPQLANIFDFLLSIKSSFLIAGLPSSGKSEFQKYLINSMNKNERVLIIDTIDELDINYNPSLDITTFVATDPNYVKVTDLLKLSLRYNPDFIVIAEARGSEFEEILTSSLSGIPTITTLHAKNIEQIIPRCINMVQMNNKNLDYSIIEDSILNHFDVLIYIDKSVDENNRVVRKIRDVSIIFNKKVNKIYENHGVEKLYSFPEEFINLHKEFESILRG